VITRVRILVVRSAPAGEDVYGTFAALARLGDDAQVESIADAAGALERARHGQVDLVVVERGPGTPWTEVLEGLRPAGPPVVAVCGGGDDDALEAFRSGAADCVAPGAGSPLPEVALEQLHRWRSQRERASLQQLHREVIQKEKMASIGQLAAGVAHEINNPIGFIHANLIQMAEYVGDLRRAWGYVESLQKAVASGVREDVGRAAEELERVALELDLGYVLEDLGKAVRESQEGSERVRHIVQDLRDFSRQDTGERLPADLNECLESTIQLVWPMMRQVARLEKRYAELPAVPCNAMQLKQVFMNLLVNAYQAIEERVGDSGETGCIEVATALRGDRVVVTVGDDGAGIPPELLDRIFDPFFTTKRVGAGTGLGLSTSFHIVERHGGTLVARRRPGRGSVFEVQLPLHGETVEAA
jgi:two-component system NtrC family sensor kinase